jgi:hypothetical protein
VIWTPLEFGKYKGKTLPQVLFSDPDWFFWAVGEGIFQKRPELRAQAEELRRKATQIRVPQTNASESLAVEHYIHRSTMKYSHFVLVPEDQPAHQGASPSFRANVIDMSFPIRIAKYDKTGCSLLVDSLKEVYFGSRSARMTKGRCEAFFNDDANFS